MISYFRQNGDSVDIIAEVAIDAGAIIQLPDGRAAHVPVAIAAGILGAATVVGIVQATMAASITMLAGQRAWFDYSANAVTYAKVNDQDFYVGRVLATAPVVTTGADSPIDLSVMVILNVDPAYDIDFAYNSVLSVPTGTQAVGGFGFPKPLGGANSLELTATSEAQCIDMVSVDKFSKAANALIEFEVRFPDAGSGAAVDINLAIGNGTSTTDFDAVTEYVAFHIDGGSLNLMAQSKDGTTTVASTDTTVDITAGSAVANRFLFQIDISDPADVQLYCNGVNVLLSTVFKIDAAVGPFGVIVHLEKSTGTTTGRIVIDRATALYRKQ